MIRNDHITTIRGLVDEMAQTRPNAIFLLDPETGRTLTFGDLQQQSIALFNLLGQEGLESGDKVAFAMENGLFTAQLFLGTMYARFVTVPLNVRAGVDQLSYMLDHCDAKVIIVGAQSSALIHEAMDSVPRKIRILPADLERALQTYTGKSPAVIPSLPGPDDVAMLMYSSGSTGKPKAAIHTHASILAGAGNSVTSHQLTPADRSLLVLPMYHINAECVTLVPTLLSGGSVVVPPRFSVSHFWDWIDDHHCSWVALVPTIISELVNWDDPRKNCRQAAFERIRFFRSSSAPLSPSLHQRFLDKFKLPLLQAMGSTEAGNVFSNPVPPGENKIGSPGLPWGFEARIIDRNGFELPNGNAGEVLLRGAALMRGYYKDAEGTAAVLDDEGWLHTGDLAYRDEDGYFFIVGRSKELVIKGGVNIAPKQIDEVLESYPGVLEAAAVGVPDPYFGEDLIAFVVLRAEDESNEDELLAFCESRLGHFKTPSRIHFVKELPKGPSGKVQRLRLLDQAVPAAAAKAACFEGESLAPNAGGGDETLSFDQIIAAAWAEVLALPQVDSNSNFFALGGHSLLAIQCLSKLREKLPVVLSFSDFFEHSTVAAQAALVRARLRRDTDMASQAPDQLEGRKPAPPVPVAILRRDPSLPVPLSPAQKRIWFIEQLNPGVPVYNEAEAVHLRGTLNIDALERALNVIVARHEVLRSTIRVADGAPHAVVHESWPLRLKRIDLSNLAPAESQSEVERLLVAEPRRLYDLEAEPGIRATALYLGPEEHVFILMMHHIVCDWASVGVIWRELSASYSSFAKGGDAVLPEVPFQSGDYASWQEQQLYSTSFAPDLKFWEEQLRDAPALLELPADRARLPVMSHRGARLRKMIGRALTERLRSTAGRENASLFTVFAAALNMLLYRYSANEDILLGIPLADRDLPELQGVIGFLLHTHVLRTKLSGNTTFRELLARVQQGVLELYAHRAAPFDQVVQKVRPERNAAYSPLFQVMLNWRDREQLLSFIGLDGLTVESLLAESGTSKFDLLLFATDMGDEIWLELEYSTDLFDEDRIIRMLGHYETLLTAVAGDPGERIAELPLLTPGEKQQALVSWNRTVVSYPKDTPLDILIEEQVNRTPDAIAAVFENIRLTYRELSKRTNHLAQCLRERGVGRNILVALCVERSLDMLVGLLGILKAGGAYVPLDPAYPSDRLAFMLKDAEPLVLLTQERLLTKLPPHKAQVICFETLRAPASQEWSEHPEVAGRKSDDLAYVLYTSGSTGLPKGVQIPHRALVNLLSSMQREPGIDYTDTLLAVTSLSFDIAGLELFLPLTVGARVVIAPSETTMDGKQLQALLERRKVTIMQATPATWRLLLESGWRGSPALKILCGGEAWPADLATDLLPRCKSLWNMYGPTETTIWSAVSRVEGGKPVLIGLPIANMAFYVLDAHCQPAPVGVPGELYIGGDSLALGYLNQPGLTQDRFVSDPFAAKPGTRMYRTGDLVRRLSDGTLEFLGRLDHQVKIRGHRIELGEIETALERHPGIERCVVVAREDSHGDHSLVAYIIQATGSDISSADLRLYLSETLPAFMIPAAFVSVALFPLTPNGKLDRKALPPPNVSTQEADVASLTPRTQTEKVLARIWCDMLDLKQVGVRDNFFDLGGHSLLAIRVIGEISKVLKLRLNVPAFYLNPTIERLAAVIDQKHHAQPEPRLISLQSGHSGLPLYLIGAGATEYQLARLLSKEDRAIFAIDIPISAEWLRAIAARDQAAMPSVEQLGELYCDALRAHVGSSPCVIAGYSFYGKIAFETAYALQRAGGNVAFVLLLDVRVRSGIIRGQGWESFLWIWRSAATGAANYTPYIDRLRVSLGNSFRLLWWLLGRMPYVLKNRYFPAKHLSGHLDNEGKPMDRIVFNRLSRFASSSWRPRPLDASGVLFRTKLPGEEMLPGFDLTYGWRDLFTRGLEIVHIAGNHSSMVVDENLAELARQINPVLDRCNLVKVNPNGDVSNKA